MDFERLLARSPTPDSKGTTAPEPFVSGSWTLTVHDPGTYGDIDDERDDNS